MSDNQSEEKSLPASQKKLRDSRRKGRVSSSRDLISGFSLLAIFVYLFMTWETIRDRLIQLLDLVSRIYSEPFNIAWRTVIGLSFEVILLTIVPAVSVLILVIIVTGMVATLGPVFSFENVKPKFENVNPATGLKRIFSMRNVVEFAKILFKVALLGSVLFLVLRYWLQAMFYAPNCGEACVVPLLLAAAKPILGVAALAFIVIGVTDVTIQRWLFLRDMRMTKTEYKRERKDLEGDPLIAGARRRERQRQNFAPRLGLKAASFIVVGEDHIAGLRYNRKDVPVPLIVIRSKGKGASAIREAAEDLKIPISEDADLATSLVAKHRPGDFLKPELFPDIARILVQKGLVS